MTRPPRAVGVRTTYDAVPGWVRSWVDETLGSPVVSVAEQVGGMSPGCASRVRCADGTRAFVKAVGTELNPGTPNLFRREIVALTLLGSHPIWADLLAWIDADGWVALLLEDVDGGHPDLSDDATMMKLVEATDELGRVLRSRVPTPPAPDPDHGGLNDIRRTYQRVLEGLEQASGLPRDLVPAWVVERVPEVATKVRELALEPGRDLVHFDIRDDNLLQRPSGELVFLDWGMAGLGPDWVDPMLARLERVEEPWFDESLAASESLVRAGDEAVTTLLVGLGVWLAWHSLIAVDVNLPTLHEFRRRESRRLLTGAARRLGVRI